MSTGFFRIVALTLLITAPVVAACGEEHVEPAFFYKAQFDPSMVAEVESFVRDISVKWQLELFEKDREQMKFLTQYREAFFISLYFECDAILAIMNVGVGNVLTLSLHDYGNLPVEQLERLANEVRSGLRAQLNIDLVAAEP